MPALTIPSEYGYVLGTTLASTVYLVFLATRVNKARSKAKVPLPYPYAEKAEAEADPLKHIFNCTQRAQQNTLEMWPIVTTLALVSGLTHPVLAASAHCVWLLGRVVFVAGYTTGKPQKRMYGVFGQMAMLPMLVAAISTVVHLLS
ncbi:hypothetical protein BC940DRAFT_291419 [Gongronella butleri]|nr:hypothetical protein BC940DRAFT_291419 [Gongronella butleri]